MSGLLDSVPLWIWGLIGLAILGATYSLWLPIWAALPATWRIAIIGAGFAVLAALWGRNKGATGALQRARDKEQARADEIRRKGAEARARADRDAIGGRLRDNDGWRRDDG